MKSSNARAQEALGQAPKLVADAVATLVRNKVPTTTVFLEHHGGFPRSTGQMSVSTHGPGIFGLIRGSFPKARDRYADPEKHATTQGWETLGAFLLGDGTLVGSHRVPLGKYAPKKGASEGTDCVCPGPLKLYACGEHGTVELSAPDDEGYHAETLDKFLERALLVIGRASGK